jgi:hypothetical protein
MRLVKSLQIRELWEQIEPAKVTELLIKKLEYPRIVNFPDDKIFHFHVREDDRAGVLWLSFKMPRQLNQRLIFLLEDEKLYQYAFFTDNPQRIGPMYEARILLGFKSVYRRAARRFSTVGSSLLIRGLLVPNDDIDMREKAPVIKVLLQSYQRMLQESFGDIQVSTYPELPDPVLEKLKSTNEGYFIKNTEDYEDFYKAKNIETDKYAFSFLAAEKFYDRDAQERHLISFKNKGIRAELLMPIVLKQKNGKLINLGYVRKKTTGDPEEEFSHKFFYGIQNTLQAIETSLFQTSIKTIKCEVPILDVSMTGISFYLKDRELIEKIINAKRSRVIIGMSGLKRALLMTLQKVYQVADSAHVRLGVRIEALQPAKPDSEVTGEILWRLMIQRATQGEGP